MRVSKVFLSYRRDGGADAARVVRDALVQRHFRVFMDVEDLRSGHFEKAILSNIEQCSHFVVVLTPGCLDRCQEQGDWLRWEVAQAIALGKNIVPVLTEGFVAWPTLPPDLAVLASFQALVYSRHLHDASMDKLAYWLGSPFRRRVTRIFRVSAVTLLALLLTWLAWDRFFPPGPVALLVNRFPPKDTFFEQPFQCQSLSGSMDSFTNGEVYVLLQRQADSRSNVINLDGQLVIKGLAASWKDGETAVTVESQEWQLPEGTNKFRLTGAKITLKLERRMVEIRGVVTAAGSNVALSNAAVSIAGITSKSDPQGRFSLSLPVGLKQTLMTLVAKLDGYEPLSRDLANPEQPQVLALVAKPPSPPPPFTQSFVVQGDGGTNHLLSGEEIEVVLQYGGKSYREVVSEQGEAKFEKIPAAMKGKDAQVSISAQGWRLRAGTNEVQLTGERMRLALERQGIVVSGGVTAADGGASLANVVVSVAGVTNVSDTQGRFSLTVPGRRVRQPMTLAAKLEGYQPFSLSITNPAQQQRVSLTPLPPFMQSLLVHGDGGPNDLLTNSEVEVVLLCGGKIYREKVSSQAEVRFERIPATMKAKNAQVSISARDWRLRAGTNEVYLTGRQTLLALERQDIVICGLVSAEDTRAPLPGARVSIAGVTNVTDRGGRFRVTVPGRLVRGTLAFAVSMGGRQPFSGQVAKLDEDQHVSLAPSREPGYPYSPLLDSLLDDAEAAKQEGRMRRADELSSKATSEYQRLADKDMTKFGAASAIAWLHRAELFTQEPDDRKPQEAYAKANAICGRLAADNPSCMAVANQLNNHGLFLNGLKDPRQHERTIMAFQRAIALYQNTVALSPYEALAGMANSHQNLGLHYAEASDFADASTSYREALRIYESLPAGQDPETGARRVQAHRGFASVLIKLGNRELAHTNYLLAIQACEVLAQASRPLYLEELAKVQSDYGAFLRSSDPARARAAYTQANELYRELANHKSWTNRIAFAHMLNSFGVLLAELDAKRNASEVERVYQDARSLSREVRNRTLELQVLCNHGVALENQNRVSEARDKFTEALKVGAGYVDQEPVGIRPILADVRLRLAKLESDPSSPIRAERVARLEAANKHLSEARKLLDKLPASPNKISLEDSARSLQGIIDAALKR